MHIPNEMLHSAVSSTSAVLALSGLAWTFVSARQAQHPPSPLSFAAVCALIFAGQLLNFPVLGGTSGHLLGGVLASALLGTAFGVLAMALVVLVQAVFFADGGVLVLGANVLNMALIGAGLGGGLYRMAVQRGWSQALALVLASWVSMMLASLACVIELVLSGVSSAAIPAMLGVHALIGLGESLLTLLLVGAVLRSNRSALWAIGMGVMLAPWASSAPDGLESVAQQYGFFTEGAALWASPLADYSLRNLGDTPFSTILACALGILLVYACALLLSRSWTHPTVRM